MVAVATPVEGAAILADSTGGRLPIPTRRLEHDDELERAPAARVTFWRRGSGRRRFPVARARGRQRRVSLGWGVRFSFDCRIGDTFRRGFHDTDGRYAIGHTIDRGVRGPVDRDRIRRTVDRGLRRSGRFG
jgi:hypothetical protein